MNADTLRALIAKWRIRETTDLRCLGEQGWFDAMSVCADELEADLEAALANAATEPTCEHGSTYEHYITASPFSSVCPGPVSLPTASKGDE